MTYQSAKTRKLKSDTWHSEETKQKISRSNKGRIAFNKGKSMSEDQKDKLSKARIEYIKKGNRPANWKGGSWVYWRSEILKRDDYTCQICGLREENIMEVAHIKPIKGLKNRVSSGHYLNSYENLVTLCPNDHARMDKNIISYERK